MAVTGIESTAFQAKDKTTTMARSHAKRRIVQRLIEQVNLLVNTISKNPALILGNFIIATKYHELQVAADNTQDKCCHPQADIVIKD